MAESLLEKFRRLVSPARMEKGVEEDAILRAPENVRERMRAIMQRRYAGQPSDRERARRAAEEEIGR